MSLTEKINADIKAAMLSKDKLRLESLRAIKSALLLLKTDKNNSEICEEDEIKILKKLVKQRKESADLYISQKRQDLAETEIAQAEIISIYLPEQMSEEEIRKIIIFIIEKTNAVGMKDMGKVMGNATKEIAGKADNKIVSTIVRELLG